MRHIRKKRSVAKTYHKKTNRSNSDIQRKNNQHNRYESNTLSPTIETLRSLAAIFNISLDTLCGMQQNGSMSMHGLTESQRQLVEALAETFRDRNRSIKKELTEQQYALLGRIIAELQK